MRTEDVERARAWRWTIDALAWVLVLGVVVHVVIREVPVDTAAAVLERCEAARDRATIDLGDARIAVRRLEETSTDRDEVDTPVYGVLVRAEITRADRVEWAAAGDECQLVLGFASALAGCTATLHCSGRDFPAPAVDCDVREPATFDPWTPPVLRYVWPADPARPLAVRLDVPAARLTIRRVSHEPAIEAEVRSITPFELP